MGILDKAVTKGIQKAIALYLPNVRTQFDGNAGPRGVPILRVWLDPTATRDYFVLDGRWWSSGPDGRADTGIKNGTGAQLISVQIAAEVAAHHRAVVYPLRSDPPASDQGGVDRDYSEQRLGECLDFLNAMAARMLPFTDNADSYAYDAVSDLNTQIGLSDAEIAEHVQTPVKLNPQQMVKLLQQSVALHLPSVETELVTVESGTLLALALPNIDDVENWFAFDGKYWIDDEGYCQSAITPELEDSPDSNFTVQEMILEVANKVLTKVAKEFSESEPIKHDLLFGEIVSWMLEVRDGKRLPELARTAQMYLSILKDDIEVRRALAGSINRPTNPTSTRLGTPREIT